MIKIPPWLKGLSKRILHPSLNPLYFFEYIAKDQDFLRLPVIKPSYLINSPEIIYHILLTNQANYTKEGTPYTRVEHIIGKGLLTTSGEDWSRRRQEFQPFFQGKHLTNLLTIINKYLEKMLDEWRKKERTINISEAMLALTMNIASESLLGIDVSAQSLTMVRNIHIMNVFAVKSIFTWKWLPSINNLRYQLAKKMVDNFILEGLQNYHSPVIEPLLSPLLSRDVEGNLTIDKKHLLEEAKNFFLAGHETTGNALSWTLYLLAKNPYVLTRLKNELHEVLGTIPANFENIQQLPYLDMVINESLRLYPPIWIITRKALAQDVVGQFKIPAEAVVHISPYLIHRHPAYWNQPSVFYPERFEDKSSRHKCAFIPFGYGPRVCIGKQFAMANIKFILAAILRNFHIKLPRANYQAAPLPLITLKAEKDIHLHLKFRK